MTIVEDIVLSLRLDNFLEYMLWCLYINSFNTILQQSAAFKILKTRLKAVPSYSNSGEQLKRKPSGDPYQFHSVPDGFRTIEDGVVVAEDGGSSRNGINFAARLQQFQQMQRQHRVLAKTRAKSRNISTSSTKVTDLFILHVDFSLFVFLFHLSYCVKIHRRKRILEMTVKRRWCLIYNLLTLYIFLRVSCLSLFELLCRSQKEKKNQ